MLPIILLKPTRTIMSIRTTRFCSLADDVQITTSYTGIIIFPYTKTSRPHYRIVSVIDVLNYSSSFFFHSSPINRFDYSHIEIGNWIKKYYNVKVLMWRCIFFLHFDYLKSVNKSKYIIFILQPSYIPLVILYRRM